MSSANGKAQDKAHEVKNAGDIMSSTAKKTTKPDDSPYPGGEDEGSKSPSQPSELPVDTNDDGPTSSR